MKRLQLSKVAVALFTVIAAGTFSFGFDIEIDIAPETLNLQSQGVVVTVHTDIAYGAVDAYSVYLNGVHIKSWKADNRGNFVAKFWMDEIKALDGLIIGDYNVLKLVGDTKDGFAFSGEAEIMVIDIEPEGKGKEK
jgi:hypothetical protein